MPFIILFLLVNLLGCASQYREELQTELDVQNAEVLNRLDMGEITQSFAEQEIQDQLKDARESLSEYYATLKKGMDVFWNGFFTSLKFGWAIANGYIGGIPGVYRLGEAGILSLQNQMTAEQSTTLPPKTFKLPPDFHHLYSSIQRNNQKCLPHSSPCRMSHWQMLREQ
jgi:hypothetical protein